MQPLERSKNPVQVNLFGKKHMGEKFADEKHMSEEPADEKHLGEKSVCLKNIYG